MIHSKINHPRFIVDAMLGNIAKKLRLFGFDTEYHSDIDDESIIKTALIQTRILITKDKRLYQRIKGTSIFALLPTSNIEIEILIDILTACKIRFINLLPNPLTRCTICNGLLITLNKNLAIEYIPRKVFEYIKCVYRCTHCKKIYWDGTHIKHVNELIKEINEQIDC